MTYLHIIVLNIQFQGFHVRPCLPLSMFWSTKSSDLSKAATKPRSVHYSSFVCRIRKRNLVRPLQIASTQPATVCKLRNLAHGKLRKGHVKQMNVGRVGLWQPNMQTTDEPNMLSYCYPIFIADTPTAHTWSNPSRIPVLDEHLPGFRRKTAPRLDGRYPLTSS